MNKQTKKTLNFMRSYDTAQLLNHAVIAYANIWYRKDKDYVGRASQNEPEKLAATLNEIAGDYKVARTLYKKGSEEWVKLADYITKLETIDADNFVKLVDDFADFHIKKNRRPISGASKLLWFRCQWPVKIYDSRAVDALKALGSKPGTRNYKKFCMAWTEEFEKHETLLNRAIACVSSRLDCTLVPKSEHSCFPQLASTPQFRERAFDQYLWLLGDPADEARARVVDE